ncbi:uncharacterized protein LOC103506335 [Diaphorina citri]|uniref:Uncharacterized protein LOC103506335 n=1 Tax=Diaphorina citri TaxID=121845 RepID=A0A1S4E7Y4_DIACI|nr:uncharacterized protein LOC103506335 [Diaphorina citri]
MSKSYLLEDDLAFLKDLHHVKLKSTESDILNQLSELKNQNVSIGNLGGNFNCELEREKLEAEKADCERLKQLVNDGTCELDAAEKQLQQLENSQEELKLDLKYLGTQVVNRQQELSKLKSQRRPGSRDKRKLQLLSNLLKVYENLLKIKLCDSSHVADKPKNLVYGFIYNNSNTYVKNFCLPLTGDAWHLLTPAARLSWSVDCSDDENEDQGLKSKVNK